MYCKFKRYKKMYGEKQIFLLRSFSFLSLEPITVTSLWIIVISFNGCTIVHLVQCFSDCRSSLVGWGINLVGLYKLCLFP